MMTLSHPTEKAILGSPEEKQISKSINLCGMERGEGSVGLRKGGKERQIGERKNRKREGKNKEGGEGDSPMFPE